METFPLHLFSTNPPKKTEKSLILFLWSLLFVKSQSRIIIDPHLNLLTYVLRLFPLLHWIAYGLSLSISSLSHLIHLLLSDSLSLFLSKVLVQLSLVVEFNVRQCFKAIRVFALRDISGRLFLAHSQRRNTQNCLMFYTEGARERRHKVNTCRMSYVNQTIRRICYIAISLYVH